MEITVVLVQEMPLQLLDMVRNRSRLKEPPSTKKRGLMTSTGSYGDYKGAGSGSAAPASSYGKNLT
jgi:hypothetical protein